MQRTGGFVYGTSFLCARVCVTHSKSPGFQVPGRVDRFFSVPALAMFRYFHWPVLSRQGIGRFRSFGAFERNITVSGKSWVKGTFYFLFLFSTEKNVIFFNPPLNEVQILNIPT